MKTKEKAIELVQKIGVSTMFTDANDGMSLPKDVAIIIAKLVVNEIITSIDHGLNNDELDLVTIQYYSEVINELNNM